MLWISGSSRVSRVMAIEMEKKELKRPASLAKKAYPSVCFVMVSGKHRDLDAFLDF